MGLLPHVSTSSLGAAEQNAVFVSALLGLAASAAFVSHTMVCRGLVGHFWKALTSRLQWKDPAMREEVMRKLRTESLHHASCINFLVTVWSCLNLVMVVVNMASGAPRWMTVWQDAVWIYSAFASIICQTALRHRQHQSTVDAVYVIYHIWQTSFVSMGSAEQLPFIAVAGCSVFGRMMWSVAYVRLPVVACLTVLHFLCACTGFARTEAPCTEGVGSQNLPIFIFVEFAGDSAIILCTVVWQRFGRRRILHEIQASILQSKSEASRSLLNIVCDATVELDEELQIMDETTRLSSLLQHGYDRSLRGSSMVQFVVEGDRQLFTDRIRSASDECIANVFHTRVRDAINNVISMEVFHVQVTGYLRANSHLIGVREYADVAENPGMLSGDRRPEEQKRKGAQRASEAATPREARLADAELCCPPSGPWPPSSSPSSGAASGACPSRTSTPCQDEIVAWIEVLSENWAIHSSSLGFEVFLGCGSQARRHSHKARELLEWVQPDQREPLIEWVQVSYQEMRTLRSMEPVQSPAARRLQSLISFRPPSLWHVKTKIAYAASITLSLPDEHQQLSTMARLRFSEIRLVEQSRALHES